MNLYLNNKQLTAEELSSQFFDLSNGDFYLLCNGRRVSLQDLPSKGDIHIVPRLLGGKGGFGSMLRAIGAQIEKTTNREACRDLSGRRLRDINEEKRLKNWIETQGERDKEAAEKKRKKLEKLCEKPKHEFRDSEYDHLRSALPEKVEDAVTQGLKASCSTKRKNPADNKTVPKKQAKLWFDEPDISGSDDSSDDEESKKSEESTKPKDTKTSSEEDIDEAENEAQIAFTKEIVQQT